jgi:hypothetical protein
VSAWCVVIAFNAPKGQGTAAFESGELKGDPAIIAAARRVPAVVLAEPGRAEDVDWSKALYFAQALRDGAAEVYGEPIEVLLPIND